MHDPEPGDAHARCVSTESGRVVPHPAGRQHLHRRGAIEVRVLGEPGRSSKNGSSRRTPFALSFRTANKGALPQRIYAVEHGMMGSYDIFLVPVGPDAVGMVYEAIFT